MGSYVSAVSPPEGQQGWQKGAPSQVMGGELTTPINTFWIEETLLSSQVIAGWHTENFTLSNEFVSHVREK